MQRKANKRPARNAITPRESFGFCNDHPSSIVHRSSFVRHTRLSYIVSADIIVGSFFAPSLNSSLSNEPFSSLSIAAKILRTRLSGVSSSSGNWIIEPT